MKRRAPSKTVDLLGYDPRELRHLGAAVAFTSGVWDRLPDKALIAWKRITDAGGDERDNVYKVPRDSLSALVKVLTENAATASLPIVVRLRGRLRHAPGRPPRVDVWEKRAANVAEAIRNFERRNGYAPTDRQIENELDLAANAISRWRSRHPELFPRS